jgi:hypothetical protein
MKSASETGEAPHNASPFDHAGSACNAAILIAAQLPQ